MDLQIEIVDKAFVTCLYDKRDDYSFKIVRLPYRSSNLPKKMFISSIAAEILRIARVTSALDSFVSSVKVLMRRMLSQGAHVRETEAAINKMITKHWSDFDKFMITPKSITSVIFS